MIAKPLKVALLSDRFEVRGSCAYTLRLVRHLHAYGIEPSIICPNADLIAAPLRETLPIRVYPHLRVPVWGRVVLGMIRNDLERQPPDLIHVQSRRMQSHGAWLARELELPYILTVHDYLSPRERLRIDRTYGRRVVAVSQSVKSELLLQAHLSSELVTVIHAGVEIPSDEDLRPVLSPEKLPVVGTAGPLEAVKGLPFFLGAAQRVLAENPRVQFLIAGAGPEEQNLRRLVRELDIVEAVTFVPNLYDFSTALEAMDIFCLPSLRQGLGTIMLDAMGRGIPVIATGVGGVFSVVSDNETGLVVPPSNSARLAERILELLNDPLKARALGTKGRELVREEFGIERMVEETADLYREVVQEVKTPLVSKEKAVPKGQLA
jgi:glycosyltransferase involved in cell wall biosynthesis